VDGWGVWCVFVWCFVFMFYVLTPHKLSEGCLEWCSFICVVFWFGWLRCFGVIVRYSAVFLPNPSRIGVLSWCSFICVLRIWH
jgi:hypothetical protein